ncbi:hypothetical protein [Moorena producens]|uniref:hypothetical protein n=1 Tax=Moorena producens TaxID=1155739 RepID=UPI0013140A52|nr:hypothetical protein [Moorena producens]
MNIIYSIYKGTADLGIGNSRKKLGAFFGVIKKRCSAVLTTLHRYSLLPTPYSLLPTP